VAAERIGALRAILAFVPLLVLTGCGCDRERPAPGPFPPPESPNFSGGARRDDAPARPAPHTTPERILAAARAEVARGTPYEPGYHRIDYPGGDVASGGVCTDLVVRAFRGAGFDLQKLVHEDMKAHFRAYPQNWGLSGPDSNIDHRRVPNLMTFFQRAGRWLPIGTGGAARATWKPGDVVFWDLGRGLRHCGIVSDRKGAGGLPEAIHNIRGAAEEPCLTRWTIIGHARYPAGSEE